MIQYGASCGSGPDGIGNESMEHIKVEEHVEFSTVKRIRKKLHGSPKMVAELICYEPGQGTPVHHHPSQDEIFYVIEGRGTMRVGDEDVALQARSLIHVPAQTSHGITAAADSRLVVLFVKSPGSVPAVRAVPSVDSVPTVPSEAAEDPK